MRAIWTYREELPSFLSVKLFHPEVKEEVNILFYLGVRHSCCACGVARVVIAMLAQLRSLMRVGGEHAGASEMETAAQVPRRANGSGSGVAGRRYRSGVGRAVALIREAAWRGASRRTSFAEVHAGSGAMMSLMPAGQGSGFMADGWPTTPRHTTFLFGESYNALSDV